MNPLELVFEAIDQVNAEAPDEAPIVKSADTPLMAQGSDFDSLKLVNLLVAVETIVEIRMKKDISLMDEDVLNSPDRPLASLGNLARYLERVTA